jgi:hypothetical protein
MIAQVIDANTYVLVAPITPGRFAVSLSTGFVNETYQGNTIDARGSSVANGLVLPGNQFGAKIVNNVFLGGNNAFQISADPTESPDIWGWSHVPFLGATIEGNTIQDVLNGATIDVQHSAYTKSNLGRVYFSGTFVNNTGIWDAGFPAGQTSTRLLTVGNALSADPGELLLTMAGNTLQGPSSIVNSPTLVVVAGTANGQPERNVSVVLPVPVTTSAPAASAKPASQVLVGPSQPATTLQAASVAVPMVSTTTSPTIVVVIPSQPTSLAARLRAKTRQVVHPLRQKAVHVAAVSLHSLKRGTHRAAAAIAQTRVRINQRLLQRTGLRRRP